MTERRTVVVSLRFLVGLVVAGLVGALLDVAVFGVQLYQYGRINQNTNVTECWAAVLDQAVNLPPPPRAVLIAEARGCAKLGHPRLPAVSPGVLDHRTRAVF